MKAYKGFNHDMTCRGFQFEIGKTYTHDGEIKLCESGFQSCEAPLDVFNFYPPTALFAEVELDGVSEETHKQDTKRVSKSLTVKAAIDISGLVKAQVEWCIRKSDATIAEGHSSKAASSGDSSKAASSGNYSKAASSGDHSKAASSGDHSKAASSGNYSKSASSGDYSKAASSGDSSTAASSGDHSKAASSGDYSKAASSGHSSIAESNGKKTIAMVAGLNGKVRAGINGAFALPWLDGEQIRIAVGIVGENANADTWYWVKDGVLAKC